MLQGGLGHGGSERQLYLFLKVCDRSAWSPHVFAASTLGHVADMLRQEGIPVTLLTGSPARKLIQFRRAVRQQRAEALVSWSSWTNVFAWALLGLRLPLIGSFRNAGYSDLPSRCRKVWAWASRAHLSTLVCNSQETERTLRRHARRGQRVLCVPNAVEVPDDVRAARALWRTELGVGDTEVLVMAIGRLTHQKAFDRFVDAVALCYAESPALRAVVIGPDYEGAASELIRHMDATGLPVGVLRYVGPRDAAREVVCAADVYLLSSLHEGMPNVVLEAMAAGVPCVTTPVGGLSELLTHEVSGLVADHDAAALARAMGRLVRDPALRRRLGDRAAERLREGYSPSQVYGPVWEYVAGAVDRSASAAAARRRRMTRAADITLCIASLPIVLPLVAMSALAVRLSGPGPVLHRTQRVGQNGGRFVLHKLRTMHVGGDIDGPGLTSADDPRVTRVGRWLRQSKLDELPQIFDVLAGHMSLVGPRPEDPRYVDLAQPAHRSALSVRPGMTSPASLAFRNEQALLRGPDYESTYREQILPRKLAIDNAYLEHPSLPAYARVLAMTALAVLPRPRSLQLVPCGGPEAAEDPQP